MMNTRRWSDNDYSFWPFTYAYSSTYKPLAVKLRSGGEEDAGCCLQLSVFGHTLIIEMPPIVTPSSQWVDLSHAERANNGGYYDINEREYGFSLAGGFLIVNYGRQTHDSSTEQSWSWFLPWTQWRHVRHSFYGLNGEYVATIPERCSWERREEIEKAVPTVSFAFSDFDGETITASTKIEERECRFGTGWFKWLSLFRKPMVRRYLDIQFSKETGREKGSWKGGTVGHGIEMRTGELHEAAFKRYCDEHQMTWRSQG